MSDKYLNDGVKFKCSGSATVRLSSKDIAHSSIKLKGKGILTDDTKLSICITGNCKFLSKPNAPVPCNICTNGIWTDCSSNTSKGNKLLLENSTIRCISGGKIFLDKASVIGIHTDNSKNTQSIKNIIITKTDINNGLNDNSNLDNSSSKGEFKLDLDESNSNVSINSVKTINTNQEEKISREDAKKFEWCSGKCPKKYKDNCPFCETSSMKLNEKNDSGKLANNMKIEFGQEYLKNFNSISNVSYTFSDNITIPCVVAHHHLISGGADCFENSQKNSYIIKLANFYGYSINNAYNGICLPSFGGNGNENYSYNYIDKLSNTKRSDAEKIIACNTIMQLTHKQIHIGQHTFKSNQKNICDKIENEELFFIVKGLRKHSIQQYDGYYELVLQDLSSFSKSLKRKFKNTCRMENQIRDRELFFNGMKHISQNIKRDLDSFYIGNTPKKCKYYVSAVALAYIDYCLYGLV